MPTSTTPSTIEIEKKTEPLLRHVVLFKFKDEASPEAVAKVETAFGALSNFIPQIKAFEWGINNSPENLNSEFTHCFFVSFENEEGRAVYLPHPKHLEFVDLLQPVLDKVLVLDYWAKS